MKELNWQYALLNLLGSLFAGSMVLTTLWLNLSFIPLIVTAIIMILIYFWIREHKPSMASKNYHYSTISIVLRLILIILIFLVAFFIVNYSDSHKAMYLILLCAFWFVGCIGEFISDLFMIYREV